MEEATLDKRDRSNLYVDSPENVYVVETSAAEAQEIIEGSIMTPEELDNAMTDALKSIGAGKIAYVAIKITP